MTPAGVLLRLLIPALLVVGSAGAAGAQSLPSRASGYAAGERPWLRCGIEESIEVDFEGGRRPHRVEWRRCGPRRAEWKPDGTTIDYPVHYVTVTRDAASPAPLIVFDNADEPSISYVESIRRMRFTRDGRQQLVVVEGIYGSGAAWALCALGLINGKLACWELPGWGPVIAPLMGADEASWKSLLRSVADDRLLVEAQIYDKTHDGNCCPSRGSIFVELRPVNGRFEPGRVWRVPPEKATR